MENASQRGSARAARSGAPLPGSAGRARRTARERIGLAVLAVERAGRGALARMRRSRLLRWRYRAPAADELLLAPPDLRGRDSSFAEEAAAGSLGLAGFIANLHGRSPFAISPPHAAWARELNGFGWLRHLDAAGIRRSPGDGPAAGRRMDQARAAAAGPCLGARGRRPPRRLLAGARACAARWRRAQALRRRHGQPHRSGHLPRRLLAQRARRLPPAPRLDRSRPRRPLHRRPRPPAGAIAEAAGRRAGAADRARRRASEPQPLHPRRAAARPPAAAPMLCRAGSDARAVAASPPSAE